MVLGDPGVSSCDELGDPGVSSYDELADWLTARVARTLNVSPDTIDVDTPLADYGVDSAASLALCADLEAEKGIAVETTIVWDYATIGAIAAYLVTEELSS